MATGAGFTGRKGELLYEYYIRQEGGNVTRTVTAKEVAGWLHEVALQLGKHKDMGFCRTRRTRRTRRTSRTRRTHRTHRTHRTPILSLKVIFLAFFLLLVFLLMFSSVLVFFAKKRGISYAGSHCLPPVQHTDRSVGIRDSGCTRHESHAAGDGVRLRHTRNGDVRSWGQRMKLRVGLARVCRSHRGPL